MSPTSTPQLGALVRWEYTNRTPYVTGRALDDWLNRLAAKGWELVTVSSCGTYYFRRPLPR